jgi:glycerate-2-kinase
MSAHIQNVEQLSISPLRRSALTIAQAALAAIDTEQVIRSAVSLQDSLLHIRDVTFDLSIYKNIRVLGFGKASCRAAAALESILGNHITHSAILTPEAVVCGTMTTYHGTHPVPSLQNVQATQHIVELAEKSEKDDLVIVVVSGGGSALLCWPESELEQGRFLYEAYIKSGGTIQQLNTVRKHLSLVKGGGLAKMLHPATVIGLIFSDVPGQHDDIVASGPTFYDATTIADAQSVAETLHLGTYHFIETPKDKNIFSNVHNITLVSNTVALDAMTESAQKIGLEPIVLSSELYDSAPQAIEKIFSAARPHSAVIAGGEISMKTHPEGSGGRNLYMNMLALEHIADNQVFIALASDGLDNSDVAGAVVDSATKQRLNELGIDITSYIEKTDAYRLFAKIDNVITTGPTGANVSDLYLLLTE